MKTKTYNPYLDIIKFVLANMVVCIHFVIPGQIGDAIDCLARVAVPFFFIVSGYYSYNCETRVLFRRFGKNLLFLTGFSLLYFIWGIWNTVYVSGGDFSSYFHDKINRTTAVDFLLYGINPFSNHLWFLHALLVSYLFFTIAQLTIKNKKILYGLLIIAMMLLLGVHLYWGSVLPMLSMESVPKKLYRNAWMFGIPLFLVGYIIHLWEYRKSSLPKRGQIVLSVLAIIGIAFGLLQWFTFGHSEMPIGILLTTISIFILSTCSNGNGCNSVFVKIAKQLGKASVWIYMIHKLVGEAIQVYSPYNSFCNQIASNWYLFPFVVMCFSICFSFIIIICTGLIKKRR